MSKIPDYPQPIGALAGDEQIAAFKDGQQISVPAFRVAALANPDAADITESVLNARSAAASAAEDSDAAVAARARVEALSAPAGTIAALAQTTISPAVGSLVVNGSSVAGDAGAGMVLVADVAVNPAYVTANPTTSFIDQAGRGFRRGQDPYGAVIARLGQVDGGDVPQYVDPADNTTKSVAQKLRTTNTGDFASGLKTRPDTNAGLYPVPFYLFGRGIEFTAYRTAGATDGLSNLQAFQQAILACQGGIGSRVIIPKDSFDFTPSTPSTVFVNPFSMIRGAPRAIPIIGAGGPAGSAINLANPGGGIGMQFYCDQRDAFDLWLEGFTVTSSYAGPAVVIGKNDFSDNQNLVRLYDFYSENSANDPANIAIRLNATPQLTWIGSKANCYAYAANDQLQAVAGTGVQCRRVQFAEFCGGAIGNAAISMAFDDNYNNAIGITGMTLENCNYAVACRSSLSGAITVKGCQISDVLLYSFYSSGMNASLQLKAIGNNYSAPGQLVDPNACEGVWIEDRRGVATPSMPSSGVPYRNTTGHPVDLAIWGGVIDSVATTPLGSIPNTGSPGQLYSLPLNPGDYVTVNYELTSGGVAVPAPSWAWSNRGG